MKNIPKKQIPITVQKGLFKLGKMNQNWNTNIFNLHSEENKKVETPSGTSTGSGTSGDSGTTTGTNGS